METLRNVRGYPAPSGKSYEIKEVDLRGYVPNDTITCFNQHLQNISNLVPLAEEFEKKKVLSFRVNYEMHRIEVEINTVGLSDELGQIMEQIRKTQNMTFLHELKNIFAVLARGPKVFRPTVEECLALEEIEMSFPFGSYVQPFPCFVVEFPSEYQKLREITALKLKSKTPFQAAPVAQVINMLPNGGVSGSTIFSAESMVLTMFMTPYIFNHCSLDGTTRGQILGDYPDRSDPPWEKGADPRFEDMLLYCYSGEHSNVTPDETVAQHRACRVAFNACMLLMQKGFQTAPDASEKRLRRLESLLAKNAKGRGRGDVGAVRRERRQIPEIYTFVQEVNIRRMVGSTDAVDVGESGERKVKPHWRRSHYKTQRYGQGNCCIKTILIPHTLVNKDRLTEAESHTYYGAHS